MVQKVLLQIEIDDANLDAAQVKADKLVATLNKAEEIAARLTAKEKTLSKADIGKLWKEAYEKGLVAIPPPEPNDGDKFDPKAFMRGTVKYMHDSAVAQAKEKPPEGGKTCERTPPDPELLRKAQERVDARKRGSDDSADIFCATLDKVIRCVAQDIFKPPN